MFGFYCNIMPCIQVLMCFCFGNMFTSALPKLACCWLLFLERWLTPISIFRVMAGDLSYCKSWPVQHWRDDWQGAPKRSVFGRFPPFFASKSLLLMEDWWKNVVFIWKSTMKTPNWEHGFMDHGVLLNIPRCRVIVVLAQLWRAPMPPSSVDTVTLQGSLWPSKGLPPTVEELW